jgi:outer membrane lipoprotein-sorting protein
VKRLFTILSVGLALARLVAQAGSLPYRRVLFCAFLALQSPAEPTLPAGADPEKVAQELVQKLRSSSPQENSVISGKLRIRPKNGEERSVPIECTIQAGRDSWQNHYRTYGPNGVPERAIVIHRPNKPNEYLYTRGTNIVQFDVLTREEAARPIGTSDFSLLDLAMDFLHWPGQRIIRTQMVKSRWCNVLESTQPKSSPRGYTKVIPWLDKESGGPLLAEAYDANGKRVKEFEIGRVKKVEGEWQLKDMAIRNVATGSRTTLEFELSGKVADSADAGRDSSR